VFRNKCPPNAAHDFTIIHFTSVLQLSSAPWLQR
jgi:hypothetical protein